MAAVSTVSKIGLGEVESAVCNFLSYRPTVTFQMKLGICSQIILYVGRLELQGTPLITLQEISKVCGIQLKGSLPGVGSTEIKKDIRTIVEAVLKNATIGALGGMENSQKIMSFLDKSLYDPEVELEQILKTGMIKGKPANADAVNTIKVVRENGKIYAAQFANMMTALNRNSEDFPVPQLHASEGIAYILKETK
jgi:hypothetical protein